MKNLRIDLKKMDSSFKDLNGVSTDNVDAKNDDEKKLNFIKPFVAPQVK